MAVYIEGLDPEIPNLNPQAFCGMVTMALAPVLAAAPSSNQPVNVPTICDNQGWYIPALADLLDSDTERNDFTGFYFNAPFSGNTFEMTLQKWDGSAWQDEAVLNDNTYGTFYDIGDLDIATMFGYKLQWRQVLQTYDRGMYRVVTTIDVFGTENTIYSYIYCLKDYSDVTANQSVRFTWNLNKRLTDPVTKIITDYTGLDLAEQIRVTGIFDYPTDEHERTEVQYSLVDGQGRKEDVRDELVTKYRFKSGYLPDEIHSIIRYRAVLSDSLFVSDYNSRAKRVTTNLEVKMDGGYEPEYGYVNKKSYRVDVEFAERLQNGGAGLC